MAMQTDTLRAAVITGVIVAVLLFSAGVVVGYYCLDPEVIVRPGVPVTEIKYVPVTVADYRECYKSIIAITGLWNDPFFKVTAQDKCKRTTQSFNIQLPARKNSLALFPVVGFNFRDFRIVYGGGVSYDRQILPILYLGAGLTVTNQDITLAPRIAFHF
jgi:5-formyltetrahydrofolate cyclo-ligase